MVVLDLVMGVLGMVGQEDVLEVEGGTVGLVAVEALADQEVVVVVVDDGKQELVL